MPCFSWMRWNCARDLVVHAGKNAIEELDHLDLRAEPPPHAAELEADHAGADHEQCFGNFASSSAPVEDTIRFSSIAMPGSFATSEPVAMTIVLRLERLRLAVAAPTSTLPGPRMRAACRETPLSCSS